MVITETLSTIDIEVTSYIILMAAMIRIITIIIMIIIVIIIITILSIWMKDSQQVEQLRRSWTSSPPFPPRRSLSLRPLLPQPSGLDFYHKDHKDRKLLSMREHLNHRQPGWLPRRVQKPQKSRKAWKTGWRWTWRRPWWWRGRRGPWRSARSIMLALFIW